MYTLLSGLWRYIRQKDEYNVLILGLDNAGKTVSRSKKASLLQVCKTHQGNNGNFSLPVGFYLK